jgi:hypothetical protein
MPQPRRHAFHLTFGTDGVAGEIRAYATGPASEPEPLPLSAQQQARLLELGWSPPDPSATGAEQHTHYVVRPFPFETVEQRGWIAAMLVATLREVYGFTMPEEVGLSAVVPNDAVRDAIAEVVDLFVLPT